MATKVIIKNEKVTPFGGLFYVMDLFNRFLANSIDKALGERGKGRGYRYSEIFLAIFCLYFSGGDCVEDITSYLKEQLEFRPGCRIPSSDTVLNTISELAEDNIQYKSAKGNSYDFNPALKLNSLLLDLLLATKMLDSKNKDYTLDFDHEFLATEKCDAKRTYKHFKGYSPGAATIGNCIVHIENRDGNANVKFMQTETLKRIFENLGNHGIHVHRARMDCGSYSHDILKTVMDNTDLFYIRAERYEALYQKAMQHTGWKEVEINNIKCEVLSLPFDAFDDIEHCRLVLQREKRKNGEQHLWEKQYSYRCIVTNDWEMEDEEIIVFYNQRGKQEKVFDEMDNDFGWKRLPKSFMNENTVFLLITAMIKNFFNFIIAKEEMRLFDIKECARIKQLVYKFITVPGKWVRSHRQSCLKLFTKKPYDLVFAQCS